MSSAQVEDTVTRACVAYMGKPSGERGVYSHPPAAPDPARWIPSNPMRFGLDSWCMYSSASTGIGGGKVTPPVSGGVRTGSRNASVTSLSGKAGPVRNPPPRDRTSTCGPDVSADGSPALAGPPGLQGEAGPSVRKCKRGRKDVNPLSSIAPLADPTVDIIPESSPTPIAFADKLV